MTTQSLTVERDRPQLQLALDFVSLNDALRTASAVHPHFDIAEIGTPLIIEEGLRALEELKARWPEKRFLADTKIMDAGRIEATTVESVVSFLKRHPFEDFTVVTIGPKEIRC